MAVMHLLRPVPAPTGQNVASSPSGIGYCLNSSVSNTTESSSNKVSGTQLVANKHKYFHMVSKYGSNLEFDGEYKAKFLNWGALWSRMFNTPLGLLASAAIWAAALGGVLLQLAFADFLPGISDD
eukprot:14717465-Ditylum_brightwellii.AAC.1